MHIIKSTITRRQYTFFVAGCYNGGVLRKTLRFVGADIRRFFSLLLVETNNFKSYIAHRPMWVVLVFAIVAVTYSVKLFEYDYSIDTGRSLYDYGYILHSWETVHRYALILLKYIFFPSGVNVYLSNVLAYTVLAFTSIVFVYSIHRIIPTTQKKTSRLFDLIAIGLFVASPIVLEQFNFSLQNFEVALGTLLTLAGSIFILIGYFRGNLSFLVAALMTWVFSVAIYQSFVPFMILLASFWVLLTLLHRKKVNFIKISSVYVGVFITTMIAYLAISYLLKLTGIIEFSIIDSATSGSGSYLGDQTAWFSSAGDTLENIKIYFMDIVLGRGLFYTLAGTILGAIVVCGIVVAKKPIVLKIQAFLALIVMMFSMFALMVFLGQSEEIRARYPTQPFFVMSVAFLAYYISNNKKIRKLLVLLLIPFLLHTILLTSRLTAIEHNKYTGEVVIAQDIINRVNTIGIKNGYQEYELIALGDWKDQRSLEIRERGMMVGVSHFEGGSHRITELMNSMGYMFHHGSSGESAVHRRICEENFSTINSMERYPSMNSVRIFNDKYVVIKLPNLPPSEQLCSGL